MQALADAYAKRRLRELREWGTVMAFAVSEPERLSEILKEPKSIRALDTDGDDNWGVWLEHGKQA